MRIIYVDLEHKCHVENDGTMTPVETEYFDGKCDAFVEGHCYEVDDTGTAIYTWKDYADLDQLQREYEQQLLAEYAASSIPVADLEAAYQEGVNSAYD